ncbi:hypothetical protein P886_3520 [Alteromonadaceae bacterium 2753L.S.0a.02]|nr:hypothetical protein P886_3520 [Alteromonadaceae bacterium 2753L.S.0a.02]
MTSAPGVQPKDDGLLTVLLERLNKQRLPHALQLRDKVDSGEPLNDFDIEFLSEVLSDIERARPIYERHPEYHSLLTKLAGLYSHIITKGAANEKLAGS